MSEAELHRHVAELVPWYVNGTLEGQDRDAVTTHLPGCPACREEVARCQTLAAAIQSAVDAAGAPGAGRLERVLASIDLLEAMGARRTGWRGRWRAGVEWLGDLFQRTPGPVRWAWPPKPRCSFSWSVWSRGRAFDRHARRTAPSRTSESSGSARGR